MTPPPSTPIPPVVALTVQIITFLCLLGSVIIMVTNKIDDTVKFNDFYAYPYMLASGVIGMAFTLLQAAFTLFYVSTGNKIGGDALSLVEFLGDMVVSYLLATGAAASFGLTVDLERLNDISEAAQGITGNSEADHFLSKAKAATSILFIGLGLTVSSSIFSSLSLPKRG